MVTLRTYWSGVEAALAKSLLDDHKIFCSLADENANLYGGGPFAMAIRLLVNEDQAELALRILDRDLGAVGDIDAAGSAGVTPAEIAASGEMLDDNPWELLAVAFCFVIPGVWCAADEISNRSRRGAASWRWDCRSVDHPFSWMAGCRLRNVNFSRCIFTSGARPSTRDGRDLRSKPRERRSKSS
jgi:hypothetical protein